MTCEPTIHVIDDDPAILASMTRATYGDRLRPELLQPVIDLAVRYDVIPKSFPASEIYDDF